MPQKITSPTRIAGLKLSNPLMNGAYINSKTAEDIELMLESPCGAVVVGSITIEPRVANKDGGYWRHAEKFYSLNSFGMPNGGLTYFKQRLPTLVTAAHDRNKPIIANVAGFTTEEFICLIKMADEAGVDMVELNLGCPNIWKGAAQKRIFSYHASLVEDILTAVKNLQPRAKVCVKISPLPPDILNEVVQVIVESNCVHAVTATNSYPNAALTTGTGKSSNILAGMTGRALKPISIGVVKQLTQLLPENIDIIGCGGVSSVSDVYDYLEAGAQAVQIATALIDKGPSIFDKILHQSANS